MVDGVKILIFAVEEVPRILSFANNGEPAFTKIYALVGVQITLEVCMKLIWSEKN